MRKCRIMYIYDKIFDMELPKTYFRNSRECFLDPYRQKLIIKTPEEVVRQRIAAYFVNNLGVPMDKIRLEEHLSHFGLSSKDRVDIVILKYNETDGLNYPLAIVECKAETVELVDTVAYQAKRYADALGCDYIFATNGIEIIVYKYVESANEYRPLNVIPTYKEMLGNDVLFLEKAPAPTRTQLDKLSDEYIIEDMIYDGFIGEDTSSSWYPYLINIFESLLDVSHIITPDNGKNINLIEDYGIRNLTYGNAGGGTFSGPYRSFVVKSDNNNTQFVSISMSSMCRNEKADSKVTTCICVAVDNFENVHHSLQLAIDKNFFFEDGKLIISHNGRITVGKLGAAKTSDLLAFVEERAPDLIVSNKVILGKLDMSELKYADSPDMMELIINLIRYALLRDEFRECVKNKGN